LQCPTGITKSSVEREFEQQMNNQFLSESLTDTRVRQPILKLQSFDEPIYYTRNYQNREETTQTRLLLDSPV